MPFVREAAAPAGEAEDFTPNQGALMDHLVKHMNVRNDAQLSRSLDIPAPTVSKLRSGRIPVGAVALIRMHEASGIEIKELRALMGDRRKHFRMTEKADQAAA